MPKSKAIRMARGLLKKAAATGRWGDHGKAGAKTRAGAAASIAQRHDFSNVADPPYVDEARDLRGRWTTGGPSLHPTEAAVMEAEDYLRRVQNEGHGFHTKKARRMLKLAQAKRALFLNTPEGQESLSDPGRQEARVNYTQYLLRTHR